MKNNYLSSGNQIVDSLAGASLKGNIVPLSWCSKIKKENGHTDLLAVLILSDIVYWYRPKFNYDEEGNIISIKKKFKGDFLQKTYDTYAESFDVSKRQVKASFDTLEELGLIKRHFKNIVSSEGIKLVNVLFVELCSCAKNILFDDRCDEIDEEVSQNSVIPVTTNCDTNTNNTTKTTTTINFIPIIPCNTKEVNERLTDDSQYREILEENTEVDALIQEQPLSADNYREIFEIMVDYVCYNKVNLKVKGNVYPPEVVKKRMLDLRREHLEYVCEVYENYLGDINDFKRHCAATLFNSYYEVNNQLSNKMRNFDYREAI